MVALSSIFNAIVKGHKDVGMLVTQALNEGTSAEMIVSEAIEAGLEEVEEKYERHEIYLPEVLLVKRGVEGCMAALGSKVTVELEERVKKHFDKLQGMCVTCRPMKLWNK